MIHMINHSAHLSSNNLRHAVPTDIRNDNRSQSMSVHSNQNGNASFFCVSELTLPRTMPPQPATHTHTRSTKKIEPSALWRQRVTPFRGSRVRVHVMWPNCEYTFGGDAHNSHMSLRARVCVSMFVFCGALMILAGFRKQSQLGFVVSTIPVRWFLFGLVGRVV